jgi:hypothetical protein
MTKIDPQLGQRVVDTFKAASDLLESANAEIDTLRDRVTKEAAADKAAKPIADAVVDKLASLVIDGEPLIFASDVDRFREQVRSKHGMAKLLADVVDILAARPAGGTKSAAELGSPSDPKDPYTATSNSSRTGFASLPRTQSFF